MSSRELRPRHRFSSTARGMYDLMCDERARSREQLLHEGMVAGLAETYVECIREGERVSRRTNKPLKDFAESGGRSFARNVLRIAVRDGHLVEGEDGLFRMETGFALAWGDMLYEARRPQQREEPTVQKFGEITYYGGMSEWEGWAYSPLHSRDIAHVRLVHAMPLDELRTAFPGWTVSESPDGLVSVSANPGVPVKQVVSEWLTANGISHEGVRDALGVKRRHLSELPDAFLNDLIANTLPIAFGVVARRHAAKLEVLAKSSEDANAWVRLWVVELISTFNAELGRPFGTWVVGQIRNKIHDLNRAINGRTASDLELKFAKAQEKLESVSGSTPTVEELASELNLSTSEMHTKRQSLAHLRSIRGAKPLNAGPDDPEVQVVDPSADPEEEAIARERAARITMAMLTSAGTAHAATGQALLELPLGFLATYLLQWDDWVKGDLAAVAACPPAKLNKEIDVIQSRLRDELADMSAAAAG